MYIYFPFIYFVFPFNILMKKQLNTSIKHLPQVNVVDYSQQLTSSIDSHIQIANFNQFRMSKKIIKKCSFSSNTIQNGLQAC